MTADAEARCLIAAALDKAPEAVPPTSSLETLDGWDSLGHVKIVLAIEERLGRTLDTDEILAVTDLAGVARLLQGPA